MYLNSYDEGRPFLNNEEVLQEYEGLLDYLFDYVLNEEFGTDDFDITAEALPDPSLDEAHEQIIEIMDWIDAREAVTLDEVSLVSMTKKLQLSRKEKLLLWLLLLPQLSGSCYRGYQKYLQLRGESRATCGFYLDLMRYAVAITSSEFLKLFTDTCHLGRYCLVKIRGEVFFGTEIGLRETIIRRSRSLPVDDGIYRRYYSYYEHTDVLYGIEGYLEQILGLFREAVQAAGSITTSGCFVRLKGGIYSGKKSLLSKMAQQLGRKLLVIRLDALNTVGESCPGEAGERFSELGAGALQIQKGRHRLEFQIF